MAANIWKKIQQKTLGWRQVVLPGFATVGLVLMAHQSGLLKSLEWMAFDKFLSLRPAEGVDTRVVIVGIDESDIKYVKGYPVPDSKLAEMLRILQAYKPRVIGLDIFKDLTSDSGHAELAKAFKEIPNIVGIEVALNKSDEYLNIKPPPELPPERVGLADLVVDSDNKLRRSILASKTWDGKLKYSLSLRLASAYLRDEGILFKHGTRSFDPIQFGSRSLPRLLADTGSYASQDTKGNQVLLNFRSNRQPFRTISLRQVLEKNFDPRWIRSSIVIIGMTAPSVKDTFTTSAVKSTLFSSASWEEESSYKLMYGVEAQAHATSQIVSTVLEGRPFLTVWSSSWAALWILFWGLLGIALGLILQSLWKTLLSIGIASVVVVGICYILLLVQGWWIPVVPTLLALWGAGLTTFFLERDLRVLLEQRSKALNRTFNAIHNGPLQELAVLLRSIGSEDLSPKELKSQLEKLNQELRDVQDSMKQEMLIVSDRLYLECDVVLDLQTPIGELLYQVYNSTLNRNFPGFTTLQICMTPNFKPLEDCYLSSAQKRDLCLFLQESLCNVGKHAIKATWIEVVCERSHSWYTLKIIDNGTELTSSSNHTRGRVGTQQAEELARQLRGKFRRLPNNPQGTICELTWPDGKSPFLALRKLARWTKKR